MVAREKIRVGLIRCDLHAMYYAILMGRCDPVALRDDRIGRGHAAYHYFYTDYNDPTKLMIPRVGGFKFTKVWDSDRGTAENFSNLWADHPQVCDSLEDVSDDVDLVFIADCNFNGSDHLQLAAPGIQKGVPTFIDKPFAYDVKDAKKLVRLAENTQTPIMSRSMLSEVPDTHYFRNRLKELGRVEFGTVKGPGKTQDAYIHTISLGLGVFGGGVKYVECMGPTEAAYIHLDYGDDGDRPQRGVMLHCDSGNGPYGGLCASAYSGRGAVHSGSIGDLVFPYGAVNILKKVKKMVATNQPQVPYHEMIEGIAIATAARLSQKQGRRVSIKNMLKR